MKRIINRSLETTLSKVSIILMAVVGGVSAFILLKLYDDVAVGSFTGFVNGILSTQHMFVFFIIGASLMAIIASNSTAMITGENAEGTLRLLVAKPNSRVQILVGKIIGTATGLVILLLISLTCYYSVIMLSQVFDGNVIKALISYCPGYILYGIVIIFILMSFSSLLSCICKKKIVALLPMLALMVITVAFFPIQRVITQFYSSEATNQLINYVDTNYHFSLIFKTCVKLFSGGVFTKSSETMSLLMKLFTSVKLDQDIVMNMGQSMTVENNALNGPMVLAIYLVISAAMYAISILIIKKKDV